MSWFTNEAHHLYFQTQVVPVICKYEGTTYTNDPKDPGGPTKYGWTLPTYRHLIDNTATSQTIKDLTKSEAMYTYEKHFWIKNNVYKINNNNLAITVLMAEINLGPIRPNKVLQSMTNEFCSKDAIIRSDGVLGPASIHKINRCKYMWPGYPYILYEFYSATPSIKKVWNWAKYGLMNRVFYGVFHG